MIHFAGTLGFGDLASLAGDESLFAATATEKLERLQAELQSLAERYDVVAANPPYMGSSSLGKWNGKWIKDNFPEAYRDLCTSFIDRGFSLSNNQGYSAMVTMQSWMFLGSYEKLRGKLLRNHTISSMAHLGTRAFGAIGGEVVSTTATVFANKKYDVPGTYLRLVDMGSEQEKAAGALEALANPDCGWFYRADASGFDAIPGSPIAYWATPSTIAAFSQNHSLSSIAKPRQGLATSDNNRFLKYWWEISNVKFGVGFSSRDEAASSKKKWFPCNKGGSFRKWYGNNEYVVNWENDGKEMLEYAASLYGSPTRTVKNMALYFQEGITWSSISSGALSMRFSPKGYIFETKGSMCFAENHEILLYILGFTNTTVVKNLMKILSPTLDFHEGPMGNLPIVETDAKTVADRVEAILPIAIDDWDSFEESWDFKRHPLL